MLTVKVEFETMEEFIDYCFPDSKNRTRTKNKKEEPEADTEEETKQRSQASLFDSTLLD